MTAAAAKTDSGFEGDADAYFASIEVKDPNNATANTFKLKVGSTDLNNYDFQFLIANLKLIPGDYEVSVSSKLISHWKCINNNSVEYWIALEKNSAFNN